MGYYWGSCPREGHWEIDLKFTGIQPVGSSGFPCGGRPPSIDTTGAPAAWMMMSAPSPNPVPGGGHFNRTLLGHFWRAAKAFRPTRFWWGWRKSFTARCLPPLRGADSAGQFRHCPSVPPLPEHRSRWLPMSDTVLDRRPDPPGADRGLQPAPQGVQML